MTAERFDKLTERQKQCLRMVHDRLQSKNIAAQLGISHHTVDDHIRAALQLLSVASRYEAARLLVAHEHPQSSMPTPLGIGHPSAVPIAPEPAAMGCDRPIEVDIVRQEGEPYIAFPSVEAEVRNRMTFDERLGRIATVATKIVVFIAGTLLVVVLFQKATRVVFDLIR